MDEQDIKKQFTHRTSRSEFWTIDRMVKLVVAVSVLIVFAFVFVLKQQGNIQQKAEEQETDLLINRAISCRVLVAIGQELLPEGPCYQEEVIQFFDPEAAANSENYLTDENRNHEEIRGLLCHLVEIHESTASGC